MGRNGHLAFLAAAGVEPDKIDYINTHGTVTEVIDITETFVIKKVFGNQANKLGINSIKYMHGHVIGAKSEVEAVDLSLALKNQTIPPTANYMVNVPECVLDIVPNNSRPGNLRYVLCNSFTFERMDAAIVFRRWKKE